MNIFSYKAIALKDYIYFQERLRYTFSIISCLVYTYFNRNTENLSVYFTFQYKVIFVKVTRTITDLD